MTVTNEAVEEEAVDENGLTEEGVTPADAGTAYGGTELLIWTDSAATVTLDGILYQAAARKDLAEGIRGSEMTIDLFDLSAPAGTVSESSDQALVGSACYQTTVDEVRYLLVEQPDGLYLFKEKTK